MNVMLFDVKDHPEESGATVFSLKVFIKPDQAGFGTVLQVAEVMQQCLNLIAIKSSGYGEAWKEQGWMGNLARVQSKTTRLKNMLWRNEPQVGGAEPVEETLRDLLNLSAFALINIAKGNQWGKP